MRVMIRIFTTTYSESVICTPYLERGEPIGPMQKGITYRVRPFIQPCIRSCSFFFIFTGSIQLLVGPASSFRRLQINVLSSTLATSLGSLKQAKLLGRFSGLSLIKVPFVTSSWQRLSYSSCEPSHQCTLVASQNDAICFTHVSSSARAGAVSMAKKLDCCDIVSNFKKEFIKRLATVIPKRRICFSGVKMNNCFSPAIAFYHRMI